MSVLGYKAGVYPRVDMVIASTEVGEAWKKASSENACHIYQIRAAINVDIYEPFTQEQTALYNYLKQRMSGLRLCDYAWRLFSQSTHSSG